MFAYIYVAVGDQIIKRGRSGILFTTYFCACPQSRTEFPMSHVVVFLVFNGLRSEVIVHFDNVDVHHHCLNFLFINHFCLRFYRILVRAIVVCYSVYHYCVKYFRTVICVFALGFSEERFVLWLPTVSIFTAWCVPEQ